VRATGRMARGCLEGAPGVVSKLQNRAHDVKRRSDRSDRDATVLSWNDSLRVAQ